MCVHQIDIQKSQYLNVHHKKNVSENFMMTPLIQTHYLWSRKCETAKKTALTADKVCISMCFNIYIFIILHVTIASPRKLKCRMLVKEIAIDNHRLLNSDSRKHLQKLNLLLYKFWSRPDSEDRYSRTTYTFLLIFYERNPWVDRRNKNHFCRFN